jgi:hypothetical protein
VFSLSRPADEVAIKRIGPKDDVMHGSNVSVSGTPADIVYVDAVGSDHAESCRTVRRLGNILLRVHLMSRKLDCDYLLYTMNSLALAYNPDQTSLQSLRSTTRR